MPVHVAYSGSGSPLIVMLDTHVFMALIVNSEPTSTKVAPTRQSAADLTLNSDFTLRRLGPRVVALDAGRVSSILESRFYNGGINWQSFNSIWRCQGVYRVHRNRHCLAGWSDSEGRRQGGNNPILVQYVTEPRDQPCSMSREPLQKD